MELELPLAPPPAPDDELHRNIDAMSYEELLWMYRCAPLNHPLFKKEIGIYFHARMKKVRSVTSGEHRAEASNRIGV